ncbi:hypothetical protein BTJ40_03170 [Microbulbifer sp. A4B17]|nr:hypothetical protein BTJ40_03170 [Microbulbifer sp. A4B17]
MGPQQTALDNPAQSAPHPHVTKRLERQKFALIFALSVGLFFWPAFPERWHSKMHPKTTVKSGYWSPSYRLCR